MQILSIYLDLAPCCQKRKELENWQDLSLHQARHYRFHMQSRIRAIMNQSKSSSTTQSASSIHQVHPLASASTLGSASTSHPASTSTHLVFIDRRVEYYRSLLASISDTFVAILVDPNQDSLDLIAQTLRLYSTVRSIHLIAHGAPGTLHLGQSPLDVEQLTAQADQIAAWQPSLTDDAEILLYGCQVGAGDRGRAFVHTLQALTGATVAASSTPIGHRDRGGNWVLDVTTAPLRSPLAISQDERDRYPALLSTVLFQDSFAEEDVVGPWIIGTGPNTVTPNPILTARNRTDGAIPGSPTGAIDPPSDGALRLTVANNNQAAFVIYNNAFTSQAGLDITFDFFMYGGTATGADGISFFLIDGDETPTQAGAFGGSLGYAQRDDGTDGLLGGFLGIGFDALGNFSNPTEGRIGGPGNQGNSVVVRGPGNGQTGYEYFAGNTVPGGLSGGPTATRDEARRTARILLETNGDLTVFIDLNGNGSFDDPGEDIIPTFNITALGANIPDTFKFGFAASTGGLNNIHEVRNLLIRTAEPITDPNTDLAVRKTGPSNVLPGTEFTYEITVTNRGPSNATNVRLQDILPSEITAADIVAISNGGTFSDTTGIISWDPINLADGDSVTYTVTVIAPDNIGTNLRNTVFVTGTEVDPNLNNNRRILNTSVVSELPSENADLRIRKLGPELVDGGDTITYRIRVRNAGPDDAENLVIRDRLPDGLTFVNAPQGTFNEENGIIRWTLASLASGETQVFRVNAIAPNRNTTVRSRATVRSATDDPNLDNNRSVAVTEIQRSQDPVEPGTVTDLRLRKLGPEEVTGGETITYRIRVRNTGPDNAINLVVRDRLPEGLTFVSAPRGTFNEDTGRIRWTLNSLASGETQVFRVNAIAPNRNITIRSRATVRSATEDSNPDNNRDAIVTTIQRDRREPPEPCEDCCEDGITLRSPSNQDSVLIGTDGNDRLVGRGGNDILRGLECDDVLIGRRGDDQLFGGPGDDFLDGGAGNDILRGGPGDDEIYGGPGDDRLFGNAGDDRIFGGPGNDVILGGPGDDVIRGGDGDDVIRGGSGDDRLFGEDGDDEIRGGPGNDIIRGGAGDDLLLGKAGDDRIFGGPGNDDIRGGLGNDIIRGGPGDDIIRGGPGDDVLDGGRGNDIIRGGPGDDIIRGGPGDDRLAGNSGDDRIFGGSGNDIIRGGPGDDFIRGGPGDDIIRGGPGDDIIYGGPGDDRLFGGNGDDTLFGGRGDDVLNGGRGSNTLSGGGGANTFVFEFIRGRRDFIVDFNPNRDKIDLSKILSAPQFNNQFFDIDAFERYVIIGARGNDTIVQINPEGGLGLPVNRDALRPVVLIRNTSPDQLSQENVIVSA
jgi:uncharacterized repeat protein (TIGR01451 family)